MYIYIILNQSIQQPSNQLNNRKNAAGNKARRQQGTQRRGVGEAGGNKARRHPLGRPCTALIEKPSSNCAFGVS